MHGKPVESRRCPRNGKRVRHREARHRIRAHPPQRLAGTQARRPRMKSMSLAGIAGLATFGAQAQSPMSLPIQQDETVVVTATRAITPAPPLRDAIAITRADTEPPGPISPG